MKFLKSISNFFLPWPTTSTTQEAEPELSSTIDVLKKNPDLTLAVANCIHDAEVRRRGTADTKAALYLAFLAAILPLIATLEPNEIDAPWRWLKWIDTALFVNGRVKVGHRAAQNVATFGVVMIAA